MQVIWLRNDLPPIELKLNEFVDKPHQSIFIDPVANTGFIHEGPTVEELEREGYVGVYIPLAFYRK